MGNDIIVLKDVHKQYRIVKKGKGGLAGTLQLLFNRQYETVNAVNGVSLTVEKGEIRGLIGPNGAGKSTVIKMISGILFPSGGEIHVMGYSPWKDRRHYVRNIGVMFGQKTQLMYDLPAVDTFYLHKHYYKIPEKRYNENLDYFRGLFGIGEIINKPVRNLSLGERIKCELVCALIHDPELVYLDEPTIGLDLFAKEAIRGFVKQINRDRQTTFILTTHDLGDIEDLCDRITIINKGTVVYDDSMEQLKRFRPDKKRIELKFSRQVDSSALEKYMVFSQSPTEAIIEIDSGLDQLQGIVAGLFRDLPVKDINIDDIGIEEIIKQIYTQ
jgi:ABC-2 type transport system ATP-binding protein